MTKFDKLYPATQRIDLKNHICQKELNSKFQRTHVTEKSWLGNEEENMGRKKIKFQGTRED